MFLHKITAILFAAIATSASAADYPYSETGITCRGVIPNGSIEVEIREKTRGGNSERAYIPKVSIKIRSAKALVGKLGKTYSDDFFISGDTTVYSSAPESVFNKGPRIAITDTAFGITSSIQVQDSKGGVEYIADLAPNTMGFERFLVLLRLDGRVPRKGSVTVAAKIYTNPDDYSKSKLVKLFARPVQLISCSK